MRCSHCRLTRTCSDLALFARARARGSLRLDDPRIGWVRGRLLRLPDPEEQPWIGPQAVLAGTWCPLTPAEAGSDPRHATMRWVLHRPWAFVLAELRAPLTWAGTRQPLDLHVSVHRLLADAAGGVQFTFKTARELSDRLLKGFADSCFSRPILLTVAVAHRDVNRL